jgi:CBS domain-containing protein
MSRDALEAVAVGVCGVSLGHKGDRHKGKLGELVLGFFEGADGKGRWKSFTDDRTGDAADLLVLAGVATNLREAFRYLEECNPLSLPPVHQTTAKAPQSRPQPSQGAKPAPTPQRPSERTTEEDEALEALATRMHKALVETPQADRPTRVGKWPSWLLERTDLGMVTATETVPEAVGTLKRYGLGCAVLPWRDATGRITGFYYRKPDRPGIKGEWKMIAGGRKRDLSGLSTALGILSSTGGEKTLYLVESQQDAQWLLGLGVPAAALGTFIISKSHQAALAAYRDRFEKVCWLPDRDEAGRNALERNCTALAAALPGVGVMFLPPDALGECKDVGEYLEKRSAPDPDPEAIEEDEAYYMNEWNELAAQAAPWQPSEPQAGQSPTDPVTTPHKAAPWTWERIQAQARSMGKGISTGLPGVDRWFRLQPGVTLVTARPGKGKSVVLLNIAWNVARDVSLPPVHFVTYEEPVASVAAKLLLLAGETDLARDAPDAPSPFAVALDCVGGKEAPECLTTATEAVTCLLESGRLSLYDGTDVGDVTDLASMLAGLGGEGVAVVDYMQRIPTAQDMRGKSRQEQLQDTSNRLLCVTKDTGLILVAGAQAGRGATQQTSKDALPQQEHLRESGDLEQDAQVILSVQATGESTVRWGIAKNRFGRSDPDGRETGYWGWKPQQFRLVEKPAVTDKDVKADLEKKNAEQNRKGKRSGK